MFRIPVTPKDIILDKESKLTLEAKIQDHQKWLEKLAEVAKTTGKNKRECLNDNIDGIAEDESRLNLAKYPDLYVDFINIQDDNLGEIDKKILSISKYFKLDFYLNFMAKYGLRHYREKYFYFTITMIAIVILLVSPIIVFLQFIIAITKIKMNYMIILKEQNFSYAILNYIKLNKANLEKINLEGTNLSGVNLKGANLLDAKIQDIIIDNQTLRLSMSIKNGVIGINGLQVYKSDTTQTKPNYELALLSAEQDPATERTGNAEVAVKNLEYARHTFGVYLTLAVVVLINILVRDGYIKVDAQKVTEIFPVIQGISVRLSLEILFFLIGGVSAIILGIVSSSVREAFIIYQHTTKNDEVVKITSFPWILTKKIDLKPYKIYRQVNIIDLLKPAFNPKSQSMQKFERIFYYLIVAIIALPIAIIIYLLFAPVLFLVKKRYYFISYTTRICMIFCVPLLLGYYLITNSPLHFEIYKSFGIYAVLGALVFVCINLFRETELFQRPFLIDTKKDKEEKERKKDAEESIAKIASYLATISEHITQDKQTKDKN